MDAAEPVRAGAARRRTGTRWRGCSTSGPSPATGTCWSRRPTSAAARCWPRGAAWRTRRGGGRRRRCPRPSALGYRWQVLEARRALGTAALLAHEPARRRRAPARRLGAHRRARASTSRAPSRSRRSSSRRSPTLGELAEARAVAGRLRALAEEQEHPWGLASAKRCDAVIRLAGADDETAGAALADAARDYAGLGLRADAARCLLRLGRAQRRERKWGAARATLERAATALRRARLAGLGGAGARRARPRRRPAAGAARRADGRPSGGWPSWPPAAARTRRSRRRCS